MIYRRPGFLAVLYFGSSPTPFSPPPASMLFFLSLPVCLRSSFLTEGGGGAGRGRMNYKDTVPWMSSFLENLPFNGLCGIVFNRFYRLEIHSLMVGIFDPACEQLPLWTKELYLCTVAPLPSLWPTSPPSPFPNIMYSIYRQCVAVGRGGGGVLSCVVDHILQEFYTLFLTRFRTYKIASPPQTKTTFRDWCL